MSQRPAPTEATTGQRLMDREALLQAAREEPDALLARLNTSGDGLSALQSRLRLERFGPNAIAHEQPVAWPRQLLRTFRNPLVFLLAALAGLSLLTGDTKAALIITTMIVFSVALRFSQEARSLRAAEALRQLVHTTATVKRHDAHQDITPRIGGRSRPGTGSGRSRHPGSPPAADRARGCGAAGRGRHGAGGCAAPAVERSVCLPGGPQRRIHASGKARQPLGAPRGHQGSHGAGNPVFSRHHRGEWHRHGRGAGHRGSHLPGLHRQRRDGGPQDHQLRAGHQPSEPRCCCALWP